MKCQCGATVKGDFCQYCGADNRTNFQRNAATVMEAQGKLFGQAKKIAKKAFIIWAVVAIIMFTAFALFVAYMVKNVIPDMDIGLVKPFTVAVSKWGSLLNV